MSYDATDDSSLCLHRTSGVAREAKGAIAPPPIDCVDLKMLSRLIKKYIV